MHPRAFVPRLTWLVCAALIALMLAAAVPAPSAARGLRLDRTFGRARGFVTTLVAGTTSLAYDGIVTTAGDIVVAGQASPPSGDGQVLVVRYRPNGRLDNRFASGGIFESALPTANAPYSATAIAQDRAGKFIIAGGYGQGSMLVMRLTRDGRLDPTFGTGRSGFATVSVGGIASSLVIQRNGGILLGGSNANRPGRPFVVARFRRDGRLDRGFGRRGIAQTAFWNPSAASSAGVNTLVPTRDGGVIASGHIDYIGGTGRSSAGHGSAGIFRLTRRGSPLRSFGTRGHVQVTIFNRRRVPESWFPCGMTVDSRGRITVIGGGGASPYALLSARVTGRGALDRSYGSAGNGRAMTPGVGGNAITTCGAMASRAGLVTVGVQSKLAQLLPDGLPNTRFAPSGVFRIAQPRQVFINTVMPSGSHRFVVAGSAGNAVYVGRYLLPTGRRR